jgi:hypothetical protein
LGKAAIAALPAVQQVTNGRRCMTSGDANPHPVIGGDAPLEHDMA